MAVTLAAHPILGALAGTFVGAAVTLLARWRGWILPEEIPWRRIPARLRRARSRRQPPSAGD